MSRITLVLLAARAALSAPAPVRIPTAWARLASADGHVHGVIDFSLGRVGMIVSLNAVGLLNATAGHAFHVHVNADPGADCSTAGPHFNPLGLDGSACDPADSNACEIGVRARPLTDPLTTQDLSGKHSMIYGSENGVATRTRPATTRC